jgi:hypothetical protein
MSYMHKNGDGHNVRIDIRICGIMIYKIETRKYITKSCSSSKVKDDY